MSCANTTPVAGLFTDQCSKMLYDSVKIESIHNADISQPACTAIQIALVDLLREWRILPESVCDHSFGEIAAAYAAGILSKEDAMKVAYFREYSVSRMSEHSIGAEGAMLTVDLSSSDVEGIIATKLSSETDEHVGIACINSPSSITVSGDRAAVEALHRIFKTNDVFSRLLRVNVAYHSPHMQSVAEIYGKALMELKPQEGQAVAFFSSVTEDLYEQTNLDTDYWVQNLLSPVRFSDVLESMWLSTTSPDIVLEIGPHSALEGPIKQTFSNLVAGEAELPIYLSTIRRKSNATRDLQEMASRLYMRGLSVNLQATNKISGDREPQVLTDLPSYH